MGSGRARAVSALAVIVSLAAAVSTSVIAWRLMTGPPTDGRLGDFQVYVEATRAAATGTGIYDYRTTTGLGFTYPPVAAVLLTPTGWPDPAHVVTLVFLIDLVLTVLIAALVARQVARRPSTRIALTAAGSAVLLQSVAVQANLVTGQISLALVALCLLDLAAVTGRAGGVLVGLSAAVKLTPGLLAVHLWLSGRRRAGVIALATAAGLTVLGFVLRPGDSVTYWTRALWDTGRVGEPQYLGNHSLLGVLTRAGLTGGTRTLAWVALSIVVLTITLLGARGLSRRGSALLAGCAVGCGTVLLSPISWPHHEVWLPVAGLLLVCRGPMPQRLFGAVILVAELLWGHLAQLPGLDPNTLALLPSALGLGVPVLGLIGRASVARSEGRPG